MGITEDIYQQGVKKGETISDVSHPMSKGEDSKQGIKVLESKSKKTNKTHTNRIE